MPTKEALLTSICLRIQLCIRQRKAKDEANGGQFDDRTKSLMVVDVGPLVKALTS